MDDLPDNGGPAFPNIAGNMVYSNGMSLRDWFAGQALAGILTRDDVVGTEARLRHVTQPLADLAYTYADAMLEARK